LNIIKPHPFAVEAFFEKSIVLTFAVPKADLQAMLPPCLELDTFDDTYGFVAMAMVATKYLRPKGFPQFLGNDFFLIGYRIFVRYTNNEGKRLRGLYILKSETDKLKMEFLGNIFTKYQYTTTDIVCTETADKITVFSEQSGFDILLNTAETEVALPTESPFADWAAARRFAGPLPFTFSYAADKNEVLIVQGMREDWKPQPIVVESFKIDYLNTLPITSYRLANAFIVKNIPYHWQKGRTEIWKKA
jgi:uncharacterized protein YqjF (DUF2071 family)